MKCKLECFVSEGVWPTEAVLPKICQKYPVKLGFGKCLTSAVLMLFSKMLMLFEVMGIGAAQQWALLKGSLPPHL